MKEDRTIVLMLRAEWEDGTIGDAQFEVHPDDPRYDEIFRHIGGIEPGEEKFVPPWPDE